MVTVQGRGRTPPGNEGRRSGPREEYRSSGEVKDAELVTAKYEEYRGGDMEVRDPQEAVAGPFR